MEPMLQETAARILTDLRNDADALWSTLEENGLTRAWVSEEDGGFGLTPADGFGLIRLAGAHAAPVPFAETLVATWFLTEANLPAPSGQMSIFIDGVQRGAPFGETAEHVVRVHGRSVSLHRGRLNEPIDSVGEDPLSDASKLSDDIIETSQIGADIGVLFGALARAAQICGALDAVLDLTISFAEQREQFGRPLTKFQAIQHLLSEMGAEAAAAGAAIDAAVASVRRDCALDETAIAVAKHRASMAAGIVSEHAHQVHGAIGYTQEYELGRFTRRLWRWREDFGGETFWANALGRAALAEPGPLWQMITKDGGK